MSGDISLPTSGNSQNSDSDPLVIIGGAAQNEQQATTNLQVEFNIQQCRSRHPRTPGTVNTTFATFDETWVSL